MANDRETSRRQTLLIAAAALGGALLLFAVWYLVLRTNYEPAFTELRSNDAATIVAELDRLKTPYRLADDGATILVPTDQVDAARIAILGSDLPLKGAVGFELFNKTDMGLTEFAQKINYQRALQGELARTIMALDEVETARVHLSLPESEIFQQDRRPAKASITVATKLGGAIDAAVVQGIQQLVASAVPELQPANVAILDAHGRLLSAAPPILMADAGRDPVRAEREDRYASDVRQALAAAGLAMPMTIKVTSFETDLRAASTSSAVLLAPVADRTGALKVSILLANEPSVMLRERLITAARQAIDFESALGDVVEVGVDPALATPGPLPGQATRPPPLANTPTATSPAPLWPFAFALALLILGLIIYRVRQRSRPLGADGRAAFAERLKALLDEEAQNGRTAA